MKTIHKFELRPSRYGSMCETVLMDHAAEIIHVAEQDGDIFLWVEVDTNSTRSEYSFEVFGTGHEMLVGASIERKHLGSVLMQSGLVFHVYHRID